MFPYDPREPREVFCFVFFFHKVDLVLGCQIILWLVSSKGSESRMGTIMLQAKNKKAVAIF